VTFTPSGFERFFQEIERRRLLAADVAELRAVAATSAWTSSARHSATKKYVRSSPKQRNAVSSFRSPRASWISEKPTARGKVEEDL